MRASKIFMMSLLFLIGFCCAVPSVTISSCSSEEVWEKIISDNPPLIIDTRDRKYYEQGHIPSAINLPYSEGVNQSIVTIIDSHNLSVIITYCSCPDGEIAQDYAEMLADFGFTNVHFMDDNFMYWPYTIVVGKHPGTIPKENDTTHNSGKHNNDPDLIFLINVFLIIAISIAVIRKKK